LKCIEIRGHDFTILTAITQ